MAVRITPEQRRTGSGQTLDMERSIAISASATGSRRLYSSIVTTAPGKRTRIHHHGPCETSIYILSGQARYTWGPSGLEHAMSAATGDFVYIPAGEIHVEENASATDALMVVLSRNCPESHVEYVDDEPDPDGEQPARC